ncbi:MAG: peptidyl-prolyl cis-trans isomerase [Melioribacteraceae bacterium]|nr:peptidyl-prolyl cis-trans isomerase [Melioribacteraceae bacterium]MCF8355317.1 peptidyl-prolyl cis-trans isomerase [Melioribacteraceae bacterium]MCF8395702.1 peptidyl-prolyl cis-trans isomerase [Melioribacteraceae bacterium]MCF8420395.1 peptidyl-prolyl cis-trans isomerase [Melioribacteraceae bacterium]
MMNLKTYLPGKANNFILIHLGVVLFLLLFGCVEQQEDEKKVVAEVNGNQLTEEDFQMLISDKRFQKKYKNEILRQWIEKELLYQEAVEQDIVSSQEFESYIRYSERELAGSMVVRNYISDNLPEITNAELVSFYDDNKEQFQVDRESYLLNMITFTDRERAIKFRSILINSDWNSAVSSFSNDSTVTSNFTNNLFYANHIQPLKFLRVVRELFPMEVSIVVETEPGMFSVVQMIETLDKNYVPEFNFVKEIVKERYTIKLQKDLYNKLIENLYTKYSVEIKRK